MVDFIEAFPVFLLVLVRVTSFFLMLPLFSYRTIPSTFKVGLGIFFRTDHVSFDGETSFRY